jgi:hypothetical protein
MSAIVKGLTDLQFHDAANIFRMLDNGDFESLVEDVRKNGLHEPIKLLDGKIIDGRNRYKACLLAGVEAVFRSIETDDPVGYVMSLNHHRRHDSKGELGLAAARAKEYYEKEAKERQSIRKGEQAGSSVENLPQLDTGKARDKAGEAFGVSGKTVDHGVAVLTKGVPELEDAIVGNKVSISKAAAIAQETPEKQKEILEDPKKLKDFKKNVAAQPKELKPKVVDDSPRFSVEATTNWQYGQMAILQLQRIQKDEDGWLDVFSKVQSWIKSRIEEYGR